MKVNNQSFRTIWLNESNEKVVQIINQLTLPHSFEILDLHTCNDACFAISEMQVRGAGLIGATAGFGMYLATLECPDHSFDSELSKHANNLKSTRPTASNLAWAVDRLLKRISYAKSPDEKRLMAKSEALAIADEDADFCRRIGQFGKSLINFPRVINKLAMMAVEIMIARQLTYFSAYEKDNDRRCDLEAGMAKLLGARVAWAAADNGLQIHGGNGFALEYKISRILCDARILNIFEGAAEIQAQVIARRILEN